MTIIYLDSTQSLLLELLETLESSSLQAYLETYWDQTLAQLVAWTLTRYQEYFNSWEI